MVCDEFKVSSSIHILTVDIRPVLNPASLNKSNKSVAIVVLPLVGLLEKTDPIPMSISEPVLSGGAEPSMAKKNNDKI